MARFRCRACRDEGTIALSGPCECPRCGSASVRIVFDIDDMPADRLDRLMQAIGQAQPLDDHPVEEGH